MYNLNKSIDWLIQIANDDRHGYDQSERYGNDYDCSSLIAKALIVGGFPIQETSWTGNLEPQLVACGWKPCGYPYKPGDIHLNYLNHVAMQIDATNIVEASINENGGTIGGKTGDQTGKEIWIREYYSYPWDVHLRYVGNGIKSKSDLINKIAMEVIDGDWGKTSRMQNRNLQRAGYDYINVQKKVKEILNQEPYY